MEIRRKVKNLLSRIILDNSVKEYIKLNKKRFLSSKLNNEKKDIILVDFIDSYPLNETYAYIVNNIAKKNNYRIKYFKFVYDEYDFFCFVNIKLKKIYNSFNAYKGFSYNFKYLFSSGIEALKVFNSIKNKEDVISIEIKGINVGDLIYDTYLRKYNEKTMDIKSIKLYYVLIQSLLIFKSIDNYFSKNSIKAVVPGDVAYIYSGLICKYAIDKNIKVYSLIESNGFLIKELEDINYYRRMPYWDYPKIFNDFNDLEKVNSIKQATTILERRLEGKNDITLSYMNKSAFSGVENRILSKTKNKKVLIPLHDFFDSPHIYRSMLFPDFWEWIVFTLESAKNTNFEWYIKPHPNALPQNKELILELKKKYEQYNNIIFLEPNVSNLTLIQDGIDAIFTVYGSVGHEFSYKDIVVVNAGDNPHIAYNFNIHVKNKDEYLYYINHIDRLKVNIDKKEIAEFFYMHYLYYKPLSLLNPVYPPQDFISLNEIGNLSSKNQRIMYHKSIETLNYYVNNYSDDNDEIINEYLNKVL